MNTFKFTGKLKRNLFLLIVAGAVLIGVGAMGYGNSGGHGDDAHGSSHEPAHAQEEHVDDHAGDLHLEDGAQDAEEAVDTHHDDADHDHEAGETEEEGSRGEGDDAHVAGAAAHDAGGHDDAHGAHAAEHGEHEATVGHLIYSNIWVMIMFFIWIAIASMFFLAAHTVGWSGWHIQIQKISLALMTLIPAMAILGAVVFIFGHHYIFEWTHLELFDPTNENFDALLATKQPFLNIKTFSILSLFWIGVLMFLLVNWWNKLKAQDQDPSLKHFSKTRTIGAISIVFIAVINAFGVWMWIMSIEPHWYSTLFAWYNMSSAAAAMFSFTILIMLYLQGQGYLPKVNENHYHDVAKYLFAISVFWTYLWFSQYMLIWYANLPEETIYFIDRMNNYPVLFYGAFIINFLLPFFVLMTREAKRNRGILIFACSVLILGHWFDFFNEIVTPLVPSGGMGLVSIGCLLSFTGIAGFVVFTALSRMTSLDSSEHPYYKESLVHHI